MAKIKKTSSEPNRVTLYFSEDDKHLLRFVDSQESKRSTFIMSLIKKAYIEQNTSSKDISNVELLQEIRNLFSEHSSLLTPIENQSTSNSEPVIDYSKIPYDNIEL